MREELGKTRLATDYPDALGNIVSYPFIRLDETNINRMISRKTIARNIGSKVLKIGRNFWNIVP